MTPKSLDRLYWEATQLPSDADREVYLDRECGGDKSLRERVQQLLSIRNEAEGFLERPIFGSTATAHVNLVGPPAESPGTSIGPYRLLEQVGEGGFGVVFLAEQEHPVRRRVAVKVIKPGMDTARVVARFEAERQALALMDHPNIAKVLDAGATPSGRPYFAMELVRGVPITRFCDEHKLTLRDRLVLFVAICQAVQHAHQKGVIHRDLKPSNVLVELRDGTPVPKIIDFGVAKATGPKLTTETLDIGFGVVGTLEYMSPEQAEINQPDVDTRSDIYSLGVMLYELLTGTTPLERNRSNEVSLLDVLRVIREEEPPSPSDRLVAASPELPAVAASRGLAPRRLRGLVRGELDWIVMKCLEKDRTRRYETANILALDVLRHLADEPVTAGPPSTVYQFRKFAHRNKVVLTATALVLTALVTGTAVSTWQAVRATHAEGVSREDQLRARRAETRAEEEAERARQLAAETEVQRRQVELHLRIALLLTDREPSLLTIREELDKRELAPEALLRIAQIVLKHTPEKEEAWKLLSEAYEATGRHTDALVHYEKAVHGAPNSAPARNRLAWFLAMSPQPEIRNPARAVHHARQAVELMPTTDWYWNTLGVAYYRIGDFPAAIEALRKSGSRGWDDGFNSFFLAMAHWQSGHPNQARWWYVRGLDRQKPALPFAGTELRRIREEAEILIGR